MSGFDALIECEIDIRNGTVPDLVIAISVSYPIALISQEDFPDFGCIALH